MGADRDPRLPDWVDDYDPLNPVVAMMRQVAAGFGDDAPPEWDESIREMADWCERAVPGRYHAPGVGVHGYFHHRPHAPDDPCPVYGDACPAPRLEHGRGPLKPRPHLTVPAPRWLESPLPIAYAVAAVVALVVAVLVFR